MHKAFVRSAVKTALGLAVSGSGLLMFALPAFAGVGGSAIPDYPNSVTVGDIGVPVTLTITNGSTGGNIGESVTLSNITHAPSCGTSLNNTCQVPDADTGVFTVHNGTGRAGTACAAVAFTAGAPDSNGNVAFTPGSTVILGPASGPLLAAQCIIDFTVDVLKVPTKDANLVAAGVQTDQLGSTHFVGNTSQSQGNGSGSDETTVVKVSPAIGTIPSAGGAVGTVLNDTATLTGGSSPIGSVTFKLYAPADFTCLGPAVYTDTDPTAPYATSPGFTSTTPGTYHWTADYAGDANNNATSSPCSAEAVTITKLSSSVATNIHNGAHGVVTSVPIGTGVHDNAHVTGAGATPTGTVAFNLYSNANCDSATTTTIGTLSGGFAESATSTAGAALGYIAYYNGDANYNPSIGVCEPLAVTKLTPIVTTDIHNAAHAVITTATVGDTVHDSATVTGSGPIPSGNVNFEFYTGPGSQVCDGVGSAAGTVALNGSGIADPSNNEGPLSAGQYYFEAHYVGDSTYNPADGPCEPLAVSKASPSISTTPSAGGPIGTVLNDTAVLSGGSSPTGSVTFRLYAPADASCSGAAAYTDIDPSAPYATSPGFTSNAAGTWHWTAVYAGDSNNNPATSTCASEPVTVTVPVGQYCSPGYWKQPQHFDNWVGYTQGQTFFSVFNRTITIKWSAKGKPGPVVNPTLLQSLQANGGGINLIAREAIDALLNSKKLSFGFTPAQVIAAVQAAIDANDPSLLDQFNIAENCPLN